MKKHFARVCLATAPLLLGILIGFAFSEAAKHQAANADDTDCKPAACEIACTAAGETDCKTAECRQVQRFGAVIGLKPEKKDYYVELHAKTRPSVLKQIRKSNIRNYSIYMMELQGKLYLFAYYEYVGDDFKADMAKMGEDAETRRWWKETDPCQARLPGTPDGEQWLQLPEVFHTD